MITLSVIVPIYNVETYLTKCIESIISQTYKNLEIILVDDGSTDKSGLIADEFAEKDKRIKVIHKENGGLVSARKCGVNHATGGYSTYVDSDDWIEPNMYEEMIEYLKDRDIDVITSGVYREYENSQVVEYDYFEDGLYDREQIENKIFPKLICTENFFETGINIHVYNKLYKTQLLCKMQQLIDDKIRVGEDAALVYPVIYNSESIYILKKAYYHYVIHSGSCMDVKFADDKERLDLLKEHLNITLKDGSKNNNFEKQIEKLYLYSLLMKQCDNLVRVENDGAIYPFGNLYRGEKIVLYGSGRVGKSVYYNIKNLVDVVLWCDKSPCEGAESINKLKLLEENDYDKILIAVANYNTRMDIVNELNNLGIDSKKIVNFNIF